MKNFLLGLFLLTSVLSTSVFATNTTALHYAIIVDAGSTGSRLHLFQYIENSNVPAIKDIFSENVKPGLSSFANNPAAAGASLKKLLDDVLIQLNQAQINPSNVSISVMATAGMRLLSSDQQQAIYASVTNYIKTQSPLNIGQIGTIPGKMEGLYGWLDVNYLAKNFQKNMPTFGSIDMGGASTQIAFATRDTSKPDDETYLKINRKQYTVFSKSFLGLGQDQALASMMMSPAANSCYPTGYSDSKVTGMFNYPTCMSLYSEVIREKNVTQQIIPTAGQAFVAYSGAYYDFNFFGVDTTPNETIVDARIQATCNESWTQLQSEHPGDKYLSGYCANAIYVSDLLYNTYQLQGPQLTIATKINQQDIDWTLGALLYNLVQNPR